MADKHKDREAELGVEPGEPGDESRALVDISAVELRAAADHLRAIVGTVESAASLLIDNVKQAFTEEVERRGQAAYPLGTKSSANRRDMVTVYEADEGDLVDDLRGETVRRHAKAERAYRRRNEPKEIEHLRVAALLERAATELEHTRKIADELTQRIFSEHGKNARVEYLYGVEVSRSEARRNYILALCAEQHSGGDPDDPCVRCANEISR